MLIATLLISLCIYQPAWAANPTPVQTFYIPFPEDQVFTALSTIFPGSTFCDTDQKGVTPLISSYVSIATIADNTIIYYDHWEDGFEVDIANPIQPTTQIWGDGDDSNGRTPGLAADMPDEVNAGTVIVLESLVDSNDLAPIDFDGGDKIGGTKTLALTRAAWSQGPKTLLAGALEVYDTHNWGTRYRAPVGEDTASLEMFESTSLIIMARRDNTLVQIDSDSDGVFEEAITLDQGQGHLVAGGVNAGALVEASDSIQVSLITGDTCEIYESRWFMLLPEDQWTSSYYNSVGTPEVDRTRVFLYNPDPNNTLDVSWVDSSGTVNITTVPAGDAVDVAVPDGTGSHFFTTDGRPFFAIAAIDAHTTGPNNKADWGFTLIPDDVLTSQVLIGWGAGRDPTSIVNPNENSSPVWAMPVSPSGDTSSVKVCADYNGDGIGPLTDSSGNGYDAEQTLAKFEIGQFKDDDGDQTGMLLYVCDGSDALLAASWGQVPGGATSGNQPALDLGTTIPPAPSFAAGKAAELLRDLDDDGEADPGDTLRYSIIVRNSSRVPVTDLVIEDTLSPYVTYVTGTTQVNLGSGLTDLADTGVTPFPLDEGGFAVDNALPIDNADSNGVFTLIFQARISDTIPLTVTSIANQAIVRTPNEEIPPEVVVPLDFNPSLELEKSTHEQGKTPEDADMPPGPSIAAGSPVIWTYTVRNTGRVSITNLIVTDSVAGVTPVFVDGDTNNNGSLEIGETWTYQATGTAINGQYMNTGTATGQDADGEQAVASDDSHYSGGTASMDVRKTSNKEMVRTGSVVTYTYDAINTGTLPITLTAVTDNRCAPVNPTLTPNGLNSGDGNLNSRFDGGETWFYSCSMVVTEDIANTVILSGTDPTGKVVPPPSTTITVTVYTPGLALEKLTAGPNQTPEDADTGSGPIISAGDSVVWTYRVNNTGDIALSDVTVVDNVAGVSPTFVSGDTNNDNLLDINETWVYEATGTATVGQYTNIGTVTAQDPDSGLLTASDPSHYFGGVARLAIDKQADQAVVKPGTTVNYSYVVSNTGNVPISNVTVSDDLCSPLVQDADEPSASTSLLDVGESWHFTCSTVLDVDTTNVATAAGNDPNGNPVDPVTDTVTVDVVHPGISIEKFTSGPLDATLHDADSAPGPNVPMGSNVRWTYIVSNTGDVPLTNINVTDNVSGVNPAFIGGDDNTDNVLDVGEAWSYQAVGEATLGQYENVGTVTAVDPFDSRMSQSDPSHYFGTNGELTVVKTASETIVKPGTVVVYTYTVSNIGNMSLQNLIILDDRCLSVLPITSDQSPSTNIGDVNQNRLMEMDEIWLYRCSMALKEDTTNVVTVTGRDTDNNPTDSVTDDATVDVVRSSIDIEKSTGSADQAFLDADLPNGPTISVGDPVTWRYEVRNTGDIPLFNVIVSDNVVGVIPVFVEGDTNNDDVLDLDEVWLYQATGTAIRDGYENIGTATATDSFGDTVQESDTSHYFGGIAAMKVEKSASEITVKPGTNVRYSYVVSNIGNLPITLTSVTDDHCLSVLPIASDQQPETNSGDTNGNGLLDVTEQWRYSCQSVLNATTTNIVTVTGQDPQGKDVPPAQDEVTVTVVVPGIHIEKSTGTAEKTPQDADQAPGLTIMVGDTVVWQYVVANTGDIPLRDVTVTDSVAGVIPAYVSGDANDDDILDLDERWLFEATGAAIVGQYMNTGTVNATDTFGDPITDGDDSHYFGGEAKLAVVKDADRSEVKAGMPVVYTYRVSNVGNVSIANVSVTDDRCSPAIATLNTANLNAGDANLDGLLNVTEVWEYTCTTALTDTTVNTVFVTGEDPDGKPIVPVTDTETVTVVTSGIAIEKSTSCPIVAKGRSAHLGRPLSCTTAVDADSPPGPIIPNGSPVAWHYEVSNTGDVPLADVVVQDNIAGVIPVYMSGDSNDDAMLGPDEVWIYEATGTAIVGQYANIGSVTAVEIIDGFFGDDISASDPSHYFGGKASMAVDKTASELEVFAGTEVVYTYHVRNTGNVPILIDEVNDDRCSPVMPELNPAMLNVGDTTINNLLDTDEVWVYTCAMVLEEDTTNVVTVTGTDPIGKPVGPATDSVTVKVVTPDVSLSKRDTLLVDKYGGPKGTPDGKPSVGDTVGYIVVITNEGESSARNVLFEDDLDLNTRLVIGSVNTSQGTVHTGNNSGDRKVYVQVGNMAPGSSVTIEFQVVIGRQLIDSVLEIQDQLLMHVTHIANHAVVMADGMEPVFSDDPDTPTPNDATSSWLIYTSKLELGMSTDSEPAATSQPPFIAPGEPVIWRYTVYNSGNLSLQNVAVSDDNPAVTPQYVSGDTNANDVLDPDEQWLYEARGASESNSATNGHYQNTGHVTASNNFSGQLSASATSEYFSGRAEITLIKSASQTLVLPNTDVTYSYQLRNTGTQPVWISEIKDDGCDSVMPVLRDVDDGRQFNHGDNNMDYWITPGESWSYSCQAVILETTTSTVMVSGINPASLPLQPTEASVTVNVARPNIRAIQSVGLAVDNDRDGRFDPGDTVRYEIVVANGSLLPGRAIVLSDRLDDALTLVDDSIVSSQGTVVLGANHSAQNLEMVLGDIPAESSVTVRFDAQISAQTSQDVFVISNQGMINGTDIPMTLTDDPFSAGPFDPTEFTVDFAPAVGIETMVYGPGQQPQDADEAPGPMIKSGDAVTWLYRVENRGNVALSEVTVSDSVIGVEPAYASGDTNDNDLLDLDELWVYEAVGVASDNVATNGQYASSGKVTAKYNTTVVVDSDPSHYLGGQLVLAVSTTMDSGQWTAGNEAWSVPASTALAFRYVVSNEGVMPLTITEMSASACDVVPELDGDGFNQGDSNQNNLIDLGENWLYGCEVVVTDTMVNTVKVAGQNVDGTMADVGQEAINVVLDSAPTPTPTLVVAFTPTPIEQVPEPTSTPTAAPTAAPTATPASTIASTVAVATATPAITVMPPTSTPTFTSTPTSTPTSLPTSAPTSTPTSVPTATPTRTPVPAPVGPTIMVGTNTVATGANVDIVLEAFSLMGVSTATINVTYDPAVLRVVSCQKDSEDKFDLMQCNKDFAPNMVRFNVTSLTGVSGDIPMAKLTFEAIGQNGDTSPIEIEVLTMTDAAGVVLPITVVDGRVIISSQRMGDVNCDGRRNSVDALFTLQHDVGLRDSSDTCTQPQRNARILYKPVCDVSQDTLCGVVDALFTLQCDVGLPNTSCPQDTVTAASRQPAIASSQPSTLESGGRIYAGTILAGTRGVVIVPIQLQEAAGINATTIEMHYDPTFLTVESCTIAEDERLNLGQCNPNYAPGVIRFNVISLAGLSGNLKLAYAMLRVQDTLTEDQSLSLVVDSTTDTSGAARSLIVADENMPQRATSSSVKLFLPIIQR